MKARIFNSILLIILTLGFSLYAKPRQKGLKITSVTFKGIRAVSKGDLYAIMVSRPSRPLARRYYHRNTFLEDLKGIELFYRQNGYLEAAVVAHQIRADSAAMTVRITIRIEEGDLTRVEGVSLLGNTIFNDKQLSRELKICDGDAFKRKQVENSTLALLRFYADHGYLDAEVQPDIRVNPEDHLALIDFNITEKQQFRIDTIRISGHQKTRERVIRRELNFKPDEVINYSKLLRSQRQLYLTGLFQSVLVHPVVPRSGIGTKKDILIEVNEKPYGEYNVAAGWGSVDKLRLRNEVFYSNIGGMGRKVGLVTRVSFPKLSLAKDSIQRSIELSFSEPWTLGTPWRTDLTLSNSYLIEPGYNLNRLGGRLTVGRQFLKRSTMTIGYRHENNRLSHIKLQDTQKRDSSNIRSLNLSAIYDTRDNLFNTTSGLYLEFSNELAGAFLRGTDAFLRSILRMKYFNTVFTNTVLGSFLDIGWMDARGGLDKIALSERFYAGGPNALRAFKYQTVGPLDSSRVPSGGRYKLVWNLIEIRQPVYKSIGVEGFIDLGNIWSDADDLKTFELRYCLGFGLRFNTPLGLVRLDYAINVARRDGEKFGMFYFSMGQAF